MATSNSDLAGLFDEAGLERSYLTGPVKVKKLDEVTLETQIKITAADVELSKLQEQFVELQARRDQVLNELKLDFVIALRKSGRQMYWGGSRPVSRLENAKIFRSRRSAEDEIKYLSSLCMFNPFVCILEK